MYEVRELMSIYIEILQEITQTVGSILKHAYKNFTFVIVLDDLQRKGIKKYLITLKQIDKRIKLILNEDNISLAFSLNKVRNIINVKYICRMVVDDISQLNKIEALYNTIVKNKVGLVFSQYYIIDENNQIIRKDNFYYKDNRIKKTLNIINLIHHLTFMIKANIFDYVGIYKKYFLNKLLDYIRFTYKNVNNNVIYDINR